MAFASSSKIIESGSGSIRRSSNKSYHSDLQDQGSQKTLDQDDLRAMNQAKLKSSSLKMQINPMNSKSQPVLDAIGNHTLEEEYPFNNLTPKDKKNSATRLQEPRTDTFNDLAAKKITP